MRIRPEDLTKRVDQRFSILLTASKSYDTVLAVKLAVVVRISMQVGLYRTQYSNALSSENLYRKEK
jgi:hypothetical protein